MKQNFKRTGGPAIAEKKSSSNLYHIEQTAYNEGTAIFLSPDGKSSKEYTIRPKLGASEVVVGDAFRRFNTDMKKKDASVGTSYWKHFRSNKLLEITPKRGK